MKKKLKKEIKALTRSINEVKNDLKEKNSRLIDEIDEVKKENIILSKAINEISGVLHNFNSNLIIKEIVERQNNINNSLKGNLIESMQKNLESLFKELEKKIDEKMKNIQTKDPITVDESGTVTPTVKPTEEKVDFEKLLEKYF